jgi:hypothetical protein
MRHEGRMLRRDCCRAGLRIAAFGGMRGPPWYDARGEYGDCWRRQFIHVDTSL